MTWRDLLQSADEKIILPWVGGNSLLFKDQQWKIEKTPQEFGWYQFKLDGRKASVIDIASPDIDILFNTVKGYLIGDRIVPDSVTVGNDILKLAKESEKVYLIDNGLDRFVRVEAGRYYTGSPLIFKCEQMPLGPEQDVLQAYLDDQSIDKIKDVSPALDASFRLERWRKDEANKRRLELEEKIRKEEERLRLYQRLGDGAIRRELAKIDFGAAAKAALAVGGAEYLDHRAAYNKNEMVVRFRLDRQRFECVCDLNMRIIDSGICLTDEHTGEKGDEHFTLESLPGVILTAIEEGVLVVFRRAD